MLALDGVRSGLLRFCSAQESSDWLCAVSANVRQLTLRDVSADPGPGPRPRPQNCGFSLFMMNPKTVSYDVKQENVYFPPNISDLWLKKVKN